MQKIISAGIIVFRRTREGLKFLILYHGGSYWNFPKGKLESEEKSWQAALREVREETGLKSTELRFVDGFRVQERFTYRRGKDKIFKIVILFLAETRQSRVVVSHEHEGYAWFTYKEAKKILARYKDSERILESAHSFLEKGSRRAAHPPSSRRGREQRPSPGVPAEVKNNEKAKDEAVSV